PYRPRVNIPTTLLHDVTVTINTQISKHLSMYLLVLGLTPTSPSFTLTPATQSELKHLRGLIFGQAILGLL
ncbi:MAG: hypothetical protein PHF20_10285, partial [Halothiobacillaceae bacterium]|nr:hypothetical protein [Halothiobacillaceae bacterium]